jgi:drug/metabolite transporter (DMT)-like permease
MKPKTSYPFFLALAAAALFGISAPFSKILLGAMDPIPLAALLYLGSGLGALVLLGIQQLRNGGKQSEARLTRKEIPWLAGAMLAGGVAAPIVLLFGLRSTPASTASLLLNFESVGTTLIAAFIFKEAIDRRIGLAVTIITIASILLSWDNSGAWGFSLGALGIVAACFLWGLDNNFTRHISAKNPLVIVAVKGLGAGSFSLLLSLLLGKGLPALPAVGWALALGAASYGLSIQLFILALRDLGAARTSAVFGIAPFVGVLLSLALFPDTPPLLFWVSIPVMVIGVILMLTESHAHPHAHEASEHTHRHYHPDEHHCHDDPAGAPFLQGWHLHPHCHEPLNHIHAHTPDLHHWHGHSASTAGED